MLASVLGDRVDVCQKKGKIGFYKSKASARLSAKIEGLLQLLTSGIM